MKLKEYTYTEEKGKIENDQHEDIVL